MNRISALLAAAVLPLAVSGCLAGSVKPMPPVADSAAGIVIRIPSPCLALMPCANKTVTFARLDGDGDVISGEIYQTSVERSDHYYLLNVPPGRYVAVASGYARGMNTRSSAGPATYTASRVFAENILFSQELVEQTAVDVTPGMLAVMGDFDFSIKGRMAFAPSAAQFMEDADVVQLHYAKTIDPEMESRGVTSGIKFYRGQFKAAKKNPAITQALLESAGKHIGADGWDRQITLSGK